MREAAARTNISRKVRELRRERHWTQAELARRLNLSQSRLSEIESGKGSFTAEQFLEILRLFNVAVTHFAGQRRSEAEIQNALARFGATHLHESADVLPSEFFREAGDLIRRVLIAPESPRHIAGLAPVLVVNVDHLNLKKLTGELIEVGLERRVGWLIDNTVAAIHREQKESLSRKWAVTYKRAEFILKTFLELDLERRARWDGSPDILDSDIRSAETLKEVQAHASAISRRWGIATGIQPADFEKALRASRVDR